MGINIYGTYIDIDINNGMGWILAGTDIGRGQGRGHGHGDGRGHGPRHGPGHK
jgi:hypothetical protein